MTLKYSLLMTIQISLTNWTIERRKKTLKHSTRHQYSALKRQVQRPSSNRSILGNGNISFSCHIRCFSKSLLQSSRLQASSQSFSFALSHQSSRPPSGIAFIGWHQQILPHHQKGDISRKYESSTRSRALNKPPFSSRIQVLSTYY